MPAIDSMSTHCLPVIDFHGFRFGDLEERKRVAREIADACSRFGFFYLVRHGIPEETIATGFGAAQEFFAQPLEHRMACRPGPKQNRGYQPMFDTARVGGKPDVKESFDMGFPLAANDPDVLAGLPFHGLNTWPDLPGFRHRIENLYFAMFVCGHQVMSAMAVAMGADQNFFVGQCDKPSTNMRLVHYPPQQLDPSEGIGASAHTDKGVVTLLLNDSNGGLHVESEEGWIDAPPLAGGLIVNVGDLMTRWTNGHFRSSVHRVVNTTGRQRYSIPQFHHPNYRATIDPARLLPDEPARFEPVTAGEFVASGFRRDRKSWRQETGQPASQEAA